MASTSRSSVARNCLRWIAKRLPGNSQDAPDEESVSRSSIPEHRDEATRFKRKYGDQSEELYRTFISLFQETMVKTSLPPSTNFVYLQCSYVVQHIRQTMMKKRYTVVGMREHFENLFCLLHILIKRKDFDAAHALCSELERLLGATKDLLTDMQSKLKLTPETNWDELLKLLNNLKKHIHEKQQPHLPHANMPVPADIILTNKLDRSYSMTFHGTFRGDPAVIKVTQSPGVLLTAAAISILRSPFIVKTVAMLRTDVEGQHMIIMEDPGFMDFFEVTNLMEKVRDDVFVAVTQQFCIAVDYMHKMGVMHRDLTTENIIINKYCRIKLIDFRGVVVTVGKYVPKAFPYYDKYCSRSIVMSAESSSEFLAPERVLPELEKKGLVGRAANWWSVGAILYNFITHKSVIKKRDRPDGLEGYKAKVDGLEFTHRGRPDTEMYNNFKALVLAFLKVVPAERLGVKGLEEIERHAFFKGYLWTSWKNGTGSLQDDELSKSIAAHRAFLQSNDSVSIDFDPEDRPFKKFLYEEARDRCSLVLGDYDYFAEEAVGRIGSAPSMFADLVELGNHFGKIL